MNMYYELADCMVGAPGKYFVVYNLPDTPDHEITRYVGLMASSQRAWKELDNGRVFYVKNKTYHQSDVVDMKEFFWIKLKSVKV